MNDSSKPCLVDTGQGFSVVYKNRHLYSQYNPARAPVSAVTGKNIRPESLVLCFSPLLGYGIPELLSSLPDNSLVLGLEADPVLFEFTQNNLPAEVTSDSRFFLLHASSVQSLIHWFESVCPVPIRRSLSIDCSGAAALNSMLYRSMVSTLDSVIATWWKNRMTLMILGRNYHRNILRNLQSLCSSLQIRSFRANRPVFVAGAGPSLDSSLPLIRRIRGDIFLLAVDTALLTLADAGITPDAIIILESQLWIEQALHGFRDSGIPVFADLTARPAAVALTGGAVSFFTTRFAHSPLLDRLESGGLLPPEIPRLGSVGIAAIHVSRHFLEPNLPVMFTGLDFSWGSGFSHSRGAPWPAMARMTAERTQGFVPAPDQPGVFSVTGKDGKPCYTNPVLAHYARLCADQYSNDALCFDLGDTGIDTGCRRLSSEEAQSLVTKHAMEFSGASPVSTAISKQQVDTFLESEYSRLKRLRDALTGAIPANADDIDNYIAQCSYLYSHFPDAHRYDSRNQSFLNRIRVEAEVFLKTIAFQCGVHVSTG